MVCMVIIPLLERHCGIQYRGSVAFQINQLKNKPKMKNQRRTKGLCTFPYIPSFHLHKQKDSDIIWWCHDCLLHHLGGKSLHTCTVESCQLTCTPADVPNPIPFTSHAQTAMWILYPIFCACDIYMLQYVPGATIFSLHKRSQAECVLWHLCSEQPFLLNWPGACVDFPTKTDHDVIRASSGDVPVTYGISDDDIYISIERL